ncbi:MAG: hypothetical protein HUU02_03935 [Bacteroidetes bacterium]|nr:hypothetical protein [Bacteroidota bacterium]
MRTQIEQIKRDFQAKLEMNSPRYRRAIIRELDYLYRKHGRGDLQAFLSAVEIYFDIPATEKALTFEVFKKSQAQIAELWDQFFQESTDLFDAADPNLFEKMQSLYKVDFRKIRNGAGEIITEEIRRSIRQGKGYEELRSRLLHRSLGEAQSRTLAITALAQFDNGMMFEYAQQGGVEKFLYDGVLHTNTRPFCREHLGKQFTLAQIRKMDNGQGIPVETSCGGYNCTHFWTPLVSELPKKGARTKKKVVSNTAAGTPVSEALSVQARGELKNKINRAMAFIDRTHGDGQLKLLPVVRMSRGKEYGRFRWYSSSREAVDIEIREDGAHVEMTTIHEVGHYLDHSGIGIRKAMSSMSDPMMDEWRNVVKGSKAYQKLKSVYDRGYIEVERLGIKEKIYSPEVRSHFSYLLSEEELWARSYAQYIAVKTKDPTLRNQLEQMRSDPIEGDSQWSDEEFAVIETEIDKLFTKLGWIQ